MEMKKYLWPLMRVAIPVLGLILCLLACMMILKSEYRHTMIPAYILIVLGCLVMLAGFYWNICHSMKTKLYQGRRCEQRIHVFTMERHSIFPPSYEECQDTQGPSHRVSEFVVTVDRVDRVDIVMSEAPPPYSLSSEDSDCRWSSEPPPQYSQVQHTHLAPEEEHL